MPQAPECGHHLVGDVEDIVGLADLEGAAVVARGRYHDPARGEDRLSDEGADLVRANVGNHALEVGNLLVTPGLDAHAFGAAVGVHVRQEADQSALGIEARLVPFLARDRVREVGRAVVALFPRDHDLLFGPAQPVVHEVHGPDRGIDRGGPAGGEEHVVQVTGRALDDFLGEDARGLGGVGKGRGVGQLAHLVGDGLGHFLATVADLGTPHAGGAVDKALTLAIPEINALRPVDEDVVVATPRIHRGPRVDLVQAIPLLQGFKAWFVVEHVGSPSCLSVGERRGRPRARI